MIASANPYLPVSANILHVRRQTQLDFTFRVAWGGQRPRPGQFFQVSARGLGEAPISASGFGDDFVEMTVRNVGRVTGGICQARPGERLLLRGPYGRGFPIERFPGRRLIVTAGGTGLAPVKGVINHFFSRPEEVKGMDVLLGFRSPDDILFRDEIDAWSARANVRLTVDRPDAGWRGHVGLITSLVASLDLQAPEQVDAIVVGPPPMMKFSARAFLERGVSRANIWVSHERRMSCGIGKCGHCRCHHTYVCLDGPVFNLSEALWLTGLKDG
ncbi:MAG: anaerobic sulfite reductase subunit AsrB [Planctomycetes bacterium]|nr:anaerobic sulfite reductase subunit AsrB [Planctomycetota bacterium]